MQGCRYVIFLQVICSFLSNSWQGLISSVLGLIAGVLIFEIIARIGKLITKTDVMGDADTYVAGAIGAAFGIYNLPIVLILGLFAYASIFVPMFLYDKIKAKNYLTCISFVLFFVSAILCFTILNNYFGIGLLLAMALLFMNFMFKEIDTNNQKRLPYIPAFFAGTLLFLILFKTQCLIYDSSILSESISKFLGVNL